MVFEDKKAIMAIGTLIMFISVIVASMIAAAVLIQATGLLQEATFEVEEDAREQLITGVDIYSIFAHANTSSEKIDGLEMFARLQPGSSPVEMATTGLTLDHPGASTDAGLNASLSGSNCTFNNLDTDSEYCVDPRFGNNDTILQQGELFVIKYGLSNETSMEPFTNFVLIMTPRVGGQTQLNLRTPELILEERFRLR